MMDEGILSEWSLEPVLHHNLLGLLELAFKAFATPDSRIDLLNELFNHGTSLLGLLVEKSNGFNKIVANLDWHH